MTPRIITPDHSLILPRGFRRSDDERHRVECPPFRRIIRPQLAIAFVQSVEVQGVASGSVTTAGITTTSGNSIILSTANFIGGGGFAISGVSDSYGNTYTSSISPVTSLTNEARQYYCNNIAGGAGHTFTVTLAGAGFVTLCAAEVSGLAASSSIDQTASGSDGVGVTASHATGNTGTLAQADEFVYANGAANSIGGTLANTDGTFTQDKVENSASGENFISAYKIVSATTAVQWNGWSTPGAREAATVLGTYKAAASSADNPYYYRSIAGHGG